MGPPGSSSMKRVDTEAANRPAATYDPRAAWCSENHSTPVPSRLLISVTTSRTAAAAGIATKLVRSESRRSASRWSGTGRTAAPSGGGAGSRAGAALSLATVQKRSATPTTKTVLRRMGSALSGLQSSQSGATMSSARRTPSAPIIVQRRSSGPPLAPCLVPTASPPVPGATRAESGPRSTAPKSTVARIRAANTAATANATPRYPAPNEPSATAACNDSSRSTRRASASPMPPTSCAPHNRRSGGSATRLVRHALVSLRQVRRSRRWGSRPLAARLASSAQPIRSPRVLGGPPEQTTAARVSGCSRC